MMNLDTKVIEDFTKLLSAVVEEKEISISLNDLTQLNKVKQMLNKCEILSSVYEEKNRLKKKAFWAENQQQIQKTMTIQKGVTTELEYTKHLVTELFKIRICVLNSDCHFAQMTFFLKNLAGLILESEDISCLFHSNNNYHHFSTINYGSLTIPTDYPEKATKLIEESWQPGKKENVLQVNKQIPDNDIASFLENNYKTHIVFKMTKEKFEKPIYFIVHYKREDIGAFESFANLDKEESLNILDSFFGTVFEVVQDNASELYSKSHFLNAINFISMRMMEFSVPLFLSRTQKTLGQIMNMNMYLFPNDLDHINPQYPRQFLLSGKEIACNSDHQHVHRTKDHTLIPIPKNDEDLFCTCKVDNIHIDILALYNPISQALHNLDAFLNTHRDTNILFKIFEFDTNRVCLEFGFDNIIRNQNKAPSNSLKDFVRFPRFDSKSEDFKLEHIFAKDPVICTQILTKLKEKENFKGMIHESTVHFSAVRNLELDDHIPSALMESPTQEFPMLGINPVVLKDDCVQKLISTLNTKYNLPTNDLEKIIVESFGKPQKKEQPIVDIIKMMAPEMGLTYEAMMNSYLADFIDNPSNNLWYANVKLKKLLSWHDNIIEVGSPSRAKEKKTHDKPLPTIFTAMNSDMDKLRQWDFDALEVKNFEDKYRMIWMMFESLNHFEKFEIQLDVFAEFIFEIQRLYNHRSNPFHNFDHGFSVAQACYMLVKAKCHSNLFDDYTSFSLVFSGLCHDVDHTGHNNAFEVMSLSPLAIKYNDNSVLENHHAATLFKLLRTPKFNILSNISPVGYRKIRKHVINNILKTDMKVHFEITNAIQEKRTKFDEDFLNKIVVDETDLLSYTGFLTHCADLSGQVKPFKIAREWSMRISKEFFNQYEEEKKEKLPVSPFMAGLDSIHSVAKQEIGFIKGIIRPMWELCNKCMKGDLGLLLKNVDNNSEEWNRILNTPSEQVDMSK